MSKYNPRANKVRKRQSVQRLTWRPRTALDTLPDLQTAFGRKPGSQRCWATGLLGLNGRGDADCPQTNIRKKPYCFYHDKLARGLMEPSGELYPAWPLPVGGYVLINQERKAA